MSAVSIAEKAISLLERFAQHPGMYVQPLNVSTVQSYLAGLRAGCELAGCAIGRDALESAAQVRGWKTRATGIVWHLRKKGLNEQAIIQELIAVEIEALRARQSTC